MENHAFGGLRPPRLAVPWCLEALEATGDVVNHAVGSLQKWQFLWETYRLGGKGDVVNHAFGSLGGHSSFGKLIDWGPQETW